ncbi:MAG: nucleotidyltransferase family protein [Nitrososphaerota archaeon]
MSLELFKYIYSFTRNVSYASNSAKMAIIILAAGLSERMGKDKQIIEFMGKPILQWVIESAKGSRVKEIYVVLGHHSDKIEKAISMDGIKKVFCKNYKIGISASLKAGVNALQKDVSAAIVMLGDQPLVKSSTIDKLVEAYDSYDADMIIPSYKGRRGNPVLLSKKTFNLIQGLEGDQGARVLMKRVRVRKIEVDDSGILLDVDTSRDLESLQAKYKNHNLTRSVRR